MSMINKGLRKFAKIKWSELTNLNSSFRIWTWILNRYKKRITYKKSLQKQYPTIIQKEHSFQMDWNNIFVQCFLVIRLFFNAFRIFFFCTLSFKFFCFFYNVLTTNLIVFYLHYRICLSQANEGLYLSRISQLTLRTCWKLIWLSSTSVSANNVHTKF